MGHWLPVVQPAAIRLGVDHVGFRQFAVEADVPDFLVLGAPSDVEPIRFGGKEIQHPIAGNEVGQNSQYHRL
jgi:hypothetical protein